VNTPARNNNPITQSNPMDASSVKKLTTMPITAQNTIHTQKNNSQRFDQNTPAYGNVQGKNQQNQSKGRVNHVTAELVLENANVVYGMFLINSIPALVYLILEHLILL
jgi:hypothetical protein